MMILHVHKNCTSVFCLFTVLARKSILGKNLNQSNFRKRTSQYVKLTFYFLIPTVKLHCNKLNKKNSKFFKIHQHLGTFCT